MKLQRIVCCAICFALPMFAQTSSKHSSNWQNQNDNPPVQNAVAQRSRWAVETLNYTQQARQALSNNDSSGAKDKPLTRNCGVFGSDSTMNGLAPPPR